MPFFIRTATRKTHTKYIIEAASLDEAQVFIEKEEYIGYVDGDDTEAEYSQSFESRELALQSDDAYTEGN